MRQPLRQFQPESGSNPAFFSQEAGLLRFVRNDGKHKLLGPGFSGRDRTDLDNSWSCAQPPHVRGINGDSSDEFVSTMKVEIMSLEDKQVLRRNWAMVAPIGSPSAWTAAYTTVAPVMRRAAAQLAEPVA